jgi:hypothetical protein
VWITHGREDALMHWCMTHQIKARELNLVGYEDEDEGSGDLVKRLVTVWAHDLR